MSALHEALGVLDRATAWMTRDPRHVRSSSFLESTLGVWVDRALSDSALSGGALPGSALPDGAPSDGAPGDLRARLLACQALLTGVDELPDAERGERVASLRRQVEVAQSVAGPPGDAPSRPRLVRLLPEGLEAPPRPRPPEPAAPPPVPQISAEPVWPPPGAVESRAATGREGPGGSSRDDRGATAREPRPQAARDERGPRGDERGPRGDERGPRPGDRGQRGDDRAQRGGRPERDGRRRGAPEGPARGPQENAPPNERPPEVRVVEAAPRPPEVKEPEPEIRAWPLGHPEATGQSVDALAVYTVNELSALAAAGIETIADLITRAPIGHDRAGERLMADVPPEGPVLVRGVVRARCTRFVGGARWYEIKLEGERGSVRCRWAAPPNAEVTALRAGQEAGLAGPVEMVDGVATVVEGELLGIDGRGGDWLPRYGVPGVAEPRLRLGVRVALRGYADTLADHLPPDILERFRLMPLPATLRDIHFPPNQTRKGRARMAFDELLQVQLGIAMSRTRTGRERGITNPVSHKLVSQALSQGGWHLSDPQEAAFDEIRRDLRRPQPMARLLQGDAGAGKQLVVQAAALVVCEAAHQVLYLAPDPLTAEHRFLFARPFFQSVGVEPVLLNGTPSRATLDAIKKGEHLVIYGATALLSALPAFRRLGLVVLEEQGAHGCVDLAPLDGENNQRPDVLVLTSTPVAASVALTIYGHLALTSLPGAPAHGVTCRAIAAPDRAEAYAVARETIEAGQQVILVLPMAKNGDLIPPSEARRLGEVLVTDHLPAARVGIFSGAMSREERLRAWEDFAHLRTDLLIATTAIEHSPAVPNAPVILVEGADAVDLVRLHRLRALVSGALRPGKMLLILGEDPSPEARRTIDLLLQEVDGWQIAELDLQYRGLDAVLGDRALDQPGLTWADPVHDRELLQKTRQEAMRLLTLDPGLKRRAHRPLVHLIRARFGDDAFPDATTSATPAAPEGPTGGGRRRGRRRR